MPEPSDPVLARFDPEPKLEPPPEPDEPPTQFIVREQYETTISLRVLGGVVIEQADAIGNESDVVFITAQNLDYVIDALIALRDFSARP